MASVDKTSLKLDDSFLLNRGICYILSDLHGKETHGLHNKALWTANHR